MPDSNEPREDLHDAQQWAEEEAFFAEVHRMTQAAHQEDEAEQKEESPDV